MLTRGRVLWHALQQCPIVGVARMWQAWGGFRRLDVLEAPNAAQLVGGMRSLESHEVLDDIGVL